MLGETYFPACFSMMKLLLSPFLSRNLLPHRTTEFGIRSRSITSPGGLCFKVEVYWLSGVYRFLVRHLPLTAQTLVSVGLNTFLCHDKGLQLSKQGEEGESA